MGRGIFKTATIAIAGSVALAATPTGAAPVAMFDYVEYRALDEAPPPDADKFRNPILPGFHPDPSIVRVGEDFYLVTSTFGWFPGLPIFHSTDLVNWKLIGHGIDRPGTVDLSRSKMVADGLYAPAIEYHDGTFYILNTCVRCGGNFMITAADPAGPWSDPVWLDFDGIDPSLFFDEQGRAWIVNNDAPPGPPQYQGHRALWLQQVDLATGKSVGKRTLLVDGGVDIATEPVWAEGPHIYRVGDWFYLSAAEGGTMEDHAQTIYRSRDLTGPYVPGPVNPVLTQRDLPRQRPERVEATGHADYVRLDDGTWWAAFLAMRPFADQSTLLGRETWLLPVAWNDGWPLILPQGEQVPLELARPVLPPSEGTDWSAWRDEFDGSETAPWLQMRDPVGVQWSLVDRQAGVLQLAPGIAAPGAMAKPHFLGRRMRHPRAQWTTALAFDPPTEGDGAGLLAFANEENFLLVAIERRKGEAALVLRRRDTAEDPAFGMPVASVPLAGGTVELRLTIELGEARVAYRPATGGAWRMLAGGVDVEHMASAHSDLFAGVIVGPYAWTGGAR